MKKILFDATVLVSGIHKNECRSGLFVASCEIFKRLLHCPGLQIDVYASPSTGNDVKEYIVQEFPSFRGKFIGDFSENFLCRLRNHIETRKGHKNSKARQLFLRGCAVFCKCLCYVIDRYAGNPVSKAELKKYDGFFSPVYLAPGFIYRAGVPRYTVLYDIIPKLFPQFCPSVRVGLSWNIALINNLNEKDYCFSISEQTKKDFLRFNSKLDPDKIVVIPLAADEKKFYPCHDPEKLAVLRKKYGIPEKPYFLSLCTIEPRKNLIFALKAFDAYLAQNPDSDVNFVLAGGHWARFAGKWENALAGMNHIKERIILTGYVDDEDLAPLYSGAEFFIYPSLYEGFGLPPLEAMQCGSPVITSNTSSLPEVVGDAGIMISPDDLEECVKAMETMVKSLAANLREFSRDSAQIREKQKELDNLIASYQMNLENLKIREAAWNNTISELTRKVDQIQDALKK